MKFRNAPFTKFKIFPIVHLRYDLYDATSWHIIDILTTLKAIGYHGKPWIVSKHQNSVPFIGRPPHNFQNIGGIGFIYSRFLHKSLTAKVKRVGKMPRRNFSTKSGTGNDRTGVGSQFFQFCSHKRRISFTSLVEWTVVISKWAIRPARLSMAYEVDDFHSFSVERKAWAKPSLQLDNYSARCKFTQKSDNQKHTHARNQPSSPSKRAN